MFYFLTLQVHIYSISASQTSLWLFFSSLKILLTYSPITCSDSSTLLTAFPFLTAGDWRHIAFTFIAFVAFTPGELVFQSYPGRMLQKKKKTKWLLAHITNSDFLKTETTRSVTCLSSCASVGCVSPGSLPLVGRGTGATQSGIHNLRAAGPCQSSAAAQHVSTPQGAISSPTCNWVFFLLPPYFQTAGLFSNRVDIRLRSKHDFRT